MRSLLFAWLKYSQGLELIFRENDAHTTICRMIIAYYYGMCVGVSELAATTKLKKLIEAQWLHKG